MNTRTKHNRALFIAATVLFWFSQYVYIPNFTPYLTSLLVMPASTAGMIIGAYGLTQALLRVPVGLVGVKADHSRHVMLIGCACLVLSSTLLSFFKSGIVLWLSRALAGVGAASWVCFTVYYSSNFSRSTEHNMGAMVIANNLGMFLAYSTSAALSDMSGISALFGLSTAAAFAAVALLCILFSMCGKVVEAPPAAISAGFLDILRNRKIWMCASFTALSQFVSFATMISFSASYAASIGCSGTQIGFISIVNTAAGIAAPAIIAGKPVDGTHGARLVTIGFACLFLYCALLPRCESFAALLGLQFTGGLGRNLIMTSQMSEAVAGIPSELRAPAMGIFQSVYGLGMMLGPIAMGALLDYTSGYVQSFAAMAALCLCCAAAPALICRGK